MKDFIQKILNDTEQEIHKTGFAIFDNDGNDVSCMFCHYDEDGPWSEVAYSFKTEIHNISDLERVHVMTWTVDDEYNEETDDYDDVVTYHQITLIDLFPRLQFLII